MTIGDAQDRYWTAARAACRAALEAQAEAPTYSEGLTAYDQKYREVMAEYERREEELDLQRHMKRTVKTCPECGTIMPTNRCAHCDGETYAMPGPSRPWRGD